MALDWLQKFYRDNHIGGLNGRLDSAARTYWLNQAESKGQAKVKEDIEYAARQNNTWNRSDLKDWVQQFYEDNNIGGPGGDLDFESRQYWLGQGASKGIQNAKNDIENTAREYGNWNWEMYPGIKYEDGQIKVQNHITKFKTDFKTDRKEKGNTKVIRECRRVGIRECEEWRDRTVPDPEQDRVNKELNDAARDLNAKNLALNNRNTKRNNAYANTVSVANNTPSGEYTIRRGQLRTHNNNNNVDEDAKNNIEDVYKQFYRDKKLIQWDSDSQGVQPPHGQFDVNYYSSDDPKAGGAAVRQIWTDALADDDIDITERYGGIDNRDPNIFYYQHYSNIGRLEGKRGNRAEAAEQTDQYTEFALTDAEKQTIRDLHFLPDEEKVGSATDRLLQVPEVAQLWDEARGGDPYWRELATKYFLDVDKKDEFAALFRLSDDPAHKQIAFNYQANTGFGVTDLEDAITVATGEKGEIDAKRFGALTQDVLKETLAEMKEAKKQEQFLSTISGFSGFSEIFDINSSLTNSILGDSGVGGIVSWMGGGKAEEDLEGSLEKITGINRNNATYNWQKWYDDKLTERYNEALELGYDPEDASKTIQIEKEFAEDFVDKYLDKRFNTSRSMDEFVEYIDVRQEEQNPFQTLSLHTAVRDEAQRNAEAFMDSIGSQVDRKFDSEFYFNPNLGLSDDSIYNTGDRRDRYDEQARIVNQDWENAKAGRKSGDIDWKAQTYRFGAVDPTDTNIPEAQRKAEFARVHYQVYGQSHRDANGDMMPFDGALDIVNTEKVQDHIKTVILPNLEEEALQQGSTFGQFITPEEFADDMLKGIDPGDDNWDAVLKHFGIEDFKGTIDELKDYIKETFMTGSAQEIRENLKYLNEKRKKPTQKILGVTYIEREEDYTDEKPKATTELYKTFQNAGFQGTEDQFYNDFFPDLDPQQQKLLQKGGKDEALKQFELDMSDPFASLGSIGSLFEDEEPIWEEEKSDSPGSYFTWENKQSDTEWGYRPRKKEDQVLGEFTGLFKGLN